MIRILLIFLLPLSAQAETLRIATFNTELSRDGPGLMLRDIRRGEDQVQSVVAVIAAVSPDVLTLQGIDWDHDGLALTAFLNRLKQAGVDYPHSFSGQPNTGQETDLDLDGDGKLYGPGDAQGWGRFTGQGGLAVLSRFPIATEEVRDFSTLLWRDLPDAQMPEKDGQPFPSREALTIQRLSSTAHWVVPIDAPGGRVHVLTFHASPPVFDGEEDRNGLRNHDEIRLWAHYLGGAFGPAPQTRFVISGDANQDPVLGEGRKPAIRSLLSDPRLQDPLSDSGPTVAWRNVGELRVDYVLPSQDWDVVDAGIHWPKAGTDARQAASGASRHRLVWVDLAP